jgi:hypothetical protein
MQNMFTNTLSGINADITIGCGISLSEICNDVWNLESKDLIDFNLTFVEMSTKFVPQVLSVNIPCIKAFIPDKVLVNMFCISLNATDCDVITL